MRACDGPRGAVTERGVGEPQVKLFVNKLTSVKTQIPFDFYSLPYCHPSKIQVRSGPLCPRGVALPPNSHPSASQGESENLGEVLSGDRIEKNSLYEVCV